jgi:hypothetical protein
MSLADHVVKECVIASCFGFNGRSEKRIDWYQPIAVVAGRHVMRAKLILLLSESMSSLWYRNLPPARIIRVVAV